MHVRLVENLRLVGRGVWPNLFVPNPRGYLSRLRCVFRRRLPKEVFPTVLGICETQDCSNLIVSQFR